MADPVAIYAAAVATIVGVSTLRERRRSVKPNIAIKTTISLTTTTSAMAVTVLPTIVNRSAFEVQITGVFAVVNVILRDGVIEVGAEQMLDMDPDKLPIDLPARKEIRPVLELRREIEPAQGLAVSTYVLLATGEIIASQSDMSATASVT